DPPPFRNAVEVAGVGDLVAVQVQDGQHAAIAGGVQELVAMPSGGERSSLGFAVTGDCWDDEVRIVERRAERVRECVAKLTALVDRSGSLGSDVAWNAAREAELFEEGFDPLFVLADARVGRRGGRL